MAAIDYSQTLITNRLRTICTMLDSGYNEGVLKLFGGTRPSAGAEITDQPLIITLLFPKPSFSSVSGKVLTINPPAPTLTVDGGEVEWARMENSEGLFILDCDVGVTGTGHPIELNTLTFFPGGQLTVNSFRLTETP